MIGLIDALTLAHTKIQHKRVLLLITTIVSGLLFGLLFAGVTIFTAIEDSGNRFVKASDDKFYMIVSPNTWAKIPRFSNGMDHPLPAETINELKAVQTDYIAKLKTAYKTVGLEFDASSVEPILVINPYINKNLPYDQRLAPNSNSPAFEAYENKKFKEWADSDTGIKVSDVQTIAMAAGADEVFFGSWNGFSGSSDNQITNLHYLPDGKEDFDMGKASSARYYDTYYSQYSGYSGYAITNSQYSTIDDSIIERFILPADQRVKSDAVPVVVFASEAVKLFGEQLGLQQRPRYFNKQLDWMRDIRQKINGTTYTTCYRNTADMDLIDQAMTIQLEIQSHQGDKNYQAPSLIYNLPTEPCGAVTIQKDTRSAYEKKFVAKQEELAKLLGTYQAPARRLVTFQIVGVINDSDMYIGGDSNLFTLLATSIAGQSVWGEDAFIPTKLYDELPESARIDDILSEKTTGDFDKIAAEANMKDTLVVFSSAEKALGFYKKYRCPPTEDCSNYPFHIQEFVRGFISAKELKDQLFDVFKVVLIIAIIISAIIMMFTMARVIIDARRETAVFQAVGAKKIDIIVVNLLYCLLVALRIAIFSAVLGYVLAFCTEFSLSESTTNLFSVIYGVFDGGATFHYVGFQPLNILVLVALIAVTALLAVAPPLARNVSRRPINDMRDE